MSEQVDILLATYQGADYLDQLLESIFTQTYPHFHLIIRDDGSTDKTMQIIQKWAEAYPHQCTLVPTGNRRGIIGNFSELMQRSYGSYAMFADQDDYWLPQKIEFSLDLLKGMERQFGSHLPLAVHTDLKVVDRNLDEISPSFWKYAHLDPSYHQLNRLLPQNVVTGCTLLMNRSLVELASPIPSTAAMHDWWVALVSACFGHIDFLDTPTILYRQHSGNDTGAQRYSLYSIFKQRNLFKKRGMEKSYRQAQAFYSRYEQDFSPEQKRILNAYLELQNLSFLKKGYQILENGFLKQGFLRNIKMLIES